MGFTYFDGHAMKETTSPERDWGHHPAERDQLLEFLEFLLLFPI